MCVCLVFIYSIFNHSHVFEDTLLTLEAMHMVQKAGSHFYPLHTEIFFLTFISPGSVLEIQAKD